MRNSSVISVKSRPLTMTDVTKEGSSESNSFYSIEVPGVLRSNGNFVVAISLFEVPESSDVQITISGGSFRLEKLITVQPISVEILSFEIPDLDPYESYFLDIQSLKGIEINDTIELIFEKGEPLAYIQLDKEAYKRGDQVDFRILMLERDLLRPINTENTIAVCLKVLDNIIFEKIVKVKRGSYVDQWTIPDEALHGNYLMKIFFNENVIASKSFEVIDYMPPKFNIDIKTPEKLIYAQKQFHVVVEANNFDGTPVQGICKLEFKSVSGFFSGVHVEKFIPINGKTENIIIDVVDDLDIDSTFIECEWFTTATIMLKATVISNEDHQESLSKLVTLKRDDAVIEEKDICSTCKPCKDCRDCCEMEEENSYYEDEESNNPIKIILPKTKKPLVGDTLSFNIQLKKPVKYCVYFVTARGNIIKSELIKVENYHMLITRYLETTFIYVPRFFILAYFIYDGVLYFDEIGFNLEKKFENKLTLSVPESADPSAVIPIEIQSSPNSLVGIMAVDKDSVVINANNDFSYEKFFKDLYLVRSQVPEMKASGRYPGLMSGMVTFTNAKMDGFEPDESEDGRYSFFPDREHFGDVDWMPRIDIERSKKKVIREMQEQNQVFGNWLFVDKETDENGILKFDEKLPEKPTVWLLTAFAINVNKGFVMTPEPLKVTSIPTNITNVISPGSQIPISKSEVTKFVFDHYGDSACSKNVTFALPTNSSPQEITFSIKKNLFGSILTHLKEFAGKMYCTGYLHMTTVTPNVAILEYLDETNQLDSEFALSIKTRFPDAIQRDFDERREDNSFGWFRSDKNGSPYVTSLVLQTFQRAANYVDVDFRIIKSGLSYLSSLQVESGEIPREEQPYKNLFEKGSSVGLTSFVLLSFLRNKKIQQQYKTFIDRGFEYIVANIEPISCVYDLAIAFYAMQLYNHSYAATLKERLFQIAQRDSENDHMWWPYSTIPNPDVSYYTPVSIYEVTSYIALGLLETEPIETILPIVKWMIPLSDLRSESMDCGLSLEVILKASVKAGCPHGTMSIAYTAFNNENEYRGIMQLTPENAGRIQTHVLPKSTTRLQFSAMDRGTVYGFVTYRYYEI